MSVAVIQTILFAVFTRAEPWVGVRPNPHEKFEIYENSRPIGNKETESSADLVDLFHMILKIHFTCEGNVALRMGTRDRLIVGMMAEMFAMDVLLEIAASPENFQTTIGQQIFVPEAKNALPVLTLDLDNFREVQGGKVGR